MKKADLVSMGIEDEDVIRQILTLHGKDIEGIKTANEEVTGQLNSYKGQLEEATKTIEGFKSMDIDSIKTAAEEWKTKAETAALEADAKVKALQFDYALDKALTGAKAKNAKAVRALLDVESLAVGEDGQIEGLDEQLGQIQTENEFLFESEEPRPRIVAGGSSRTVISDSVVDAARKAAGLGT
jgi:hypothetical protein